MRGKILDFLLRYILLILIALPNLAIFYYIFTPLTIYPVYYLLDIFFNASLIGNIIKISCTPIAIIDSCIAGAAYYLLLILNLSTPNIKTMQRIKMILISFASLLILNILRIFLLSALSLSHSVWFDLTHKLFWYILSIVIVIGIWFAQVKYYKIKEIPFYSDLKDLYSHTKHKETKTKKIKRKSSSKSKTKKK